MNTLWVTGGNGFLGGEVVRIARERRIAARVLSLSRRPVPGDPDSVSLDLVDAEAVTRAFEAVPPDAVIHLAAASSPDWCEAHPERSRAINVQATLSLARLCAAGGQRLVFASTDLVFDGTSGSYAETAPPNPCGVYARQKVEAERELAAVHARGACICRLPLQYGPPAPSGRDPWAWLHDALYQDVPRSLFIDEFRSMASTRAVAEGLLMALTAPIPLLHLGGREHLSRYEYACRLAAWLGRPTSSLVPARVAGAARLAPRPPNVTLDSRLAWSMGFDPWPLEEEWKAAGLRA